MKLSYKIILSLSFLTVISIVISGLIFYFGAKKSLGERIGAQLESVSILKINRLNDYIARSTKNLEKLATKQQLHANLQASQNQALTDLLSGELVEQIDFFEYFIVDMNRSVLVSTDPSQVGKFKSGEPYFNKGKETTYVQSFYHDTSLQQPAITISTPIKDKSGNTIAVLVGRVNIEIISKFISETSGIGSTGETYLVNKNNLVLTELKGEKTAAFKKAIYTDGVKSCLKNNSGFKYYTDYNQVPVIGYYLWIPERETCFVAEIDQIEAMAPLNQIKNLVIIASLAILIFIIFIGILISYNITKPIVSLKDAAEKIKAGDLNTRITIKSADEIGQLAKSFNNMADNLQTSYSLLEEKVSQRTSELEETKQKIETINTDLEQRVKVRTEELEKLKKDLEANIVQRTLELNQSVEKLNSTASLLSATLNSISEGILVVDASGKVQSYNNRFIELWRVPDSILQTQDDIKLLDYVSSQLEDPQGFITKVNDLYSHPDLESFDILKFKDGKIFERNSRPQKMANTIIGRVWSFKDATIRLKAEDELKKHTAELEKINQIMVDRELKMIELKQEIASLNAKISA